jgi:hypothetical protein
VHGVAVSKLTAGIVDAVSFVETEVGEADSAAGCGALSGSSVVAAVVVEATVAVSFVSAGLAVVVAASGAAVGCVTAEGTSFVVGEVAGACEAIVGGCAAVAGVVDGDSSARSTKPNAMKA